MSGKLNPYQKIVIMEAQIDHVPVEEEILVYKNDFFNGMVLLLKKLFML